MNNSDIIAIIAIGASIITSIISSIVIIATTQSNNKAKLSEIAFEKRLNAFQEVYELISNITSRLNLFKDVFSNLDYSQYLDYQKIINNEFESTVNKARAETMRRLHLIDSGFLATYNTQRVYIPQHIDKLLIEYYVDVLKPINTMTLEEIIINIPKMKQKQDKYSDSILQEIQEFIGIK